MTAGIVHWFTVKSRIGQSRRVHHGPVADALEHSRSTAAADRPRWALKGVRMKPRPRREVYRVSCRRCLSPSFRPRPFGEDLARWQEPAWT